MLAAVAVALVAIYAAAGFLWAPRLIRSQAEEFVSENFGRKVEIGEIRFNPFTFELNVGRFALAWREADGSINLLELKQSLPTRPKARCGSSSA